MKKLIPTLALLAALPLTIHAQSMEEIMRQAAEYMEKNGGAAITMEEISDPLPPLEFTGSMRLVVHSTGKGIKASDETAEIRLAFKSDGMAMVPETKDPGKQIRMVFDLPARHSYTLITDEKGNKSAIKMKMMRMSSTATSPDDPNEPEGQVVRTEETKTIEGHSCRKYTYSAPDGSGEAWIAEDVKFDVMRAFANMAGGDHLQHGPRMGYEGLMMESTWTAADGSTSSTMHVKDLKVGTVDEGMFSLAGYQIQDMTSMPMMGR